MKKAAKLPMASCHDKCIFHDASGNAIPNESPVPDIIDDLFERSRFAEMPVTHDTLLHWSGDTLDYNGVLDALFQKRSDVSSSCKDTRS